MNRINRRHFLGRSALAAAGAVATFSARSWASVPGANNTIRAAVVGIGGRGKDHIGGFNALAKAGVRVVALCDVDRKILTAGADGYAKKGQNVDSYVDIRKLLDRQDVDVISIATPNHWHALGTIWAVQAGKDVYVEKPVCHNVWEGGKMVEAARQYRKIVQTGTQSRSSQAIREAVEWVQDGHLGRIRVARGLCYKPRASIGKIAGPQPIPAEVDYDLWCGPAPKTKLSRGRLHYDWHWVWATGNGDLGNQGIHQMDIARWFLGETTLSPRVWSVGGRLGYQDDGETPNTQIVYHGYDRAPLIFEVRGLPRSKDKRTDKGWGSGDMDKYPSDQKDRGGSVCVLVECEGGTVFVPNYSSAVAFDAKGVELKRWSGATDHYDNFIQAVRSRKHTDLTADIQEGFLSSSLCHTGNISYLLGAAQAPGAVLEQIRGDSGASATFERMRDHLEANGIDIETERVTFGPVLQMNPRTERFIGNPAADTLLTRKYRKPFVVPDKV